MYSSQGLANMEVFDLSEKGKARKIYSFGEVFGGKFLNNFSLFILSVCSLLVVGPGDVAYNIRRSLIGAISIGEQTASHLFSIDSSKSIGNKDIVKLIRKSKWHPQYSSKESNY